LQGLSRDEYDTPPSLFKKYVEATTRYDGGASASRNSWENHEAVVFLPELLVGRDGVSQEPID